MSLAMNLSALSPVELEKRRHELTQQMLGIRSTTRGAVSEQFVPVPHKGKKKPVLRGPYYVLSWWENGKTHSRRIHRDDLERTRQELANYERLKALCQEFEALTQALGQAEREQAASQEAVKKGLKSRPRRTPK